MATCLLTQGTTVTVQDSLLAATLIAGTYSLTITGAAKENIERTDFASTSKEFCPGLPDEGEVTLNIRSQNGDAGQDELDAIYDSGAIREFVITDDEGYTRTFDAYVNNITESADANSIWDKSVTLKISGGVVKAAP